MNVTEAAERSRTWERIPVRSGCEKGFTHQRISGGCETLDRLGEGQARQWQAEFPLGADGGLRRRPKAAQNPLNRVRNQSDANRGRGGRITNRITAGLKPFGKDR